MAVITNKLGLLAIAGNIQDVSVQLEVGLFKNDVTPTLTIVLGASGGQLNEATFSGYARQVATLSAESWDAGNGWAVLQAALVTFTKTAGGSPETIYGWFATLLGPDAGQHLLMADRFSPAQTMTNTDDAIKVTPAVFFKP